MSYRGQRRFGNTPITRAQFSNVVKVGYGFSLGHWLFRLTLRGARGVWSLFLAIIIAANFGIVALAVPVLRSLPITDDGRTVLLIIIVLVTTLVTGYWTYRIFRWVGIKAYQWAERNL